MLPPGDSLHAVLCEHRLCCTASPAAVEAAAAAVGKCTCCGPSTRHVCTQRRAARLRAVTHSHPDHVGALGPLLRWYPGARMVLHEREAQYLLGGASMMPPGLAGAALSAAMRLFHLPPAPPPPAERAVLLAGAGGSLAAQGLPGLQWLATHGHSPGHVSYLHTPSGVLLAGDALAFFQASTLGPGAQLRGWQVWHTAADLLYAACSAWLEWPKALHAQSIHLPVSRGRCRGWGRWPGDEPCLCPASTDRRSEPATPAAMVLSVPLQPGLAGPPHCVLVLAGTTPPNCVRRCARWRPAASAGCCRRTTPQGWG